MIKKSEKIIQSVDRTYSLIEMSDSYELDKLFLKEFLFQYIELCDLKKEKHLLCSKLESYAKKFQMIVVHLTQ